MVDRDRQKPNNIHTFTTCDSWLFLDSQSATWLARPSDVLAIDEMARGYVSAKAFESEVFVV